MRAGLLEQVAGPREIYGRPLTAYAAQFIGQTNLLRAEVRDGIASAGSILWRTLRRRQAKSLFPCGRNAIRIVPPSRAATGRRIASVAQFRGRVRNQTFGGAMDVLEIDCGDSQFLRARMPSPGPVSGEHGI